MREELQDPHTYYSILRAIAAGRTRVGQIAERVGASSSPRVGSYLGTLQALGLTTYQQPIAGKERRGTWSIADPYLRFWFRFELPHKAQLEHDASPERLYREVVAPELDHFVSKPAFEEICRAWVGDQNDRGLTPEISAVGAWWGPIPQPTPKNPRNQGEGEIEVVAARQNRVRLFGEAKWTKEPVGFAVLNHLRMVSRFVPGADENAPFYTVWSDLRSAVARGGQGRASEARRPGNTLRRRGILTPPG